MAGLWLTDMTTPELRQGHTGRWAFVIKTKEGKIMAMNERGRNVTFDEPEWLALPLVTPAVEGCNPDP